MDLETYMVMVYLTGKFCEHCAEKSQQEFENEVQVGFQVNFSASTGEVEIEKFEKMCKEKATVLASKEHTFWPSGASKGETK